MKTPLSLTLMILLFAVGNSRAQDYLDTTNDHIIQPDLSEGIPNDDELQFMRFHNEMDYSYIEGLSDNGIYVTSKENSATIAIRKENIGLVVLYTKVFDPKDSSRFNPLDNRSGKVMINSYRGTQGLKDLTLNRDFSESSSQQIFFKTEKYGVDKIQITFNTDNPDYRFIIEKLKVIPLNKDGIDHYKQNEETISELNNWTDTLTREAGKIKQLYIDQINDIELFYGNLTSVISGQKFQNMAIAKSNSLNPFTDNTFTTHIDNIMLMASKSDQDKFKRLSEPFRNNGTMGLVATSLDNLILGGKFGSMINLIDGLFDKQITLTDASSGTSSQIIAIDGKYFEKTNSMMAGQFKLKEVDQAVSDNIKSKSAENKAISKYMADIAKFIQEDAEYYKLIAEEITLANRLREEFKSLILSVLTECELPNTEGYFEGTIVFSKMSSDLEREFNADSSRTISELWQFKSASINHVKRFKELKADYYELMTRIVNHYNVLYEVNPRERRHHFEDLEALPAKLSQSWTKGQQLIIDTYNKTDGLKELLTEASGQNFQ